MISKKRRHRAILSQPPTGRRAFKGILHPLLLAGQSIAPSATPATANFDPYAVATVTQPNTDISESTSYYSKCELTDEERAYCEMNPSYPWCKKANVLSNDPLCIPTSELDMERARKNKADWINTRSCVLGDTRPGKTTWQKFGGGCFPTFRDAMPGDVRQVIAPFNRDALFGPTAKLLGWDPDKPAI